MRAALATVFFLPMPGSPSSACGRSQRRHGGPPDEVLACYDGAQPDAPIEGLAKLLVPRGIDPARIASLRLYGLYSGNLSSWYQSTIDAFTVMFQDDDTNVKAVATAGVELFTRQRDQAARNERLQRIRGHS
jgi:hypothetical protein